MMKTRTVIFGVLVGLALPRAVLWADELERMDPRDARKMAKQLCLEARKFKNPPVPIVPDVTQAEGVHRADDVGIVLVPQKDLQEGNSAAMAAVKTETGAALGYLFTYQVVPAVGGELVSPKELRRLTLTSDEGSALPVSCLLLAVRQRTDDDWRLYVYGIGRKPLVDVPFQQKAGPGHRPVAIECIDVEGFEGNLVVTVFGRYQAQFRVGYQPE